MRPILVRDRLDISIRAKNTKEVRASRNLKEKKPIAPLPAEKIVAAGNRNIMNEKG